MPFIAYWDVNCIHQWRPLGRNSRHSSHAQKLFDLTVVNYNYTAGSMGYFMESHNVRDIQRTRGWAIRFVHSELFSSPLVRVESCLTLGFVLLFTIVNPLGTEEGDNLTVCFAYWGLCATACWPICRGQDAITLYLTRSWTPPFVVLATSIGTLVAAIPCTALVSVIHRAFFGSLPKPSLLEMYLVVALLLVGISALLHYIACLLVKLSFWSSPAGTAPPLPSIAPKDPHSESASAGHDRYRAPLPGRESYDRRREPLRQVEANVGPSTGREPESFLRHLPDGVGRDIISLKAAEHYVEVTTTSGTALILMRFRDAVAELGNLGIRVHRSHWVAHRHAKLLPASRGCQTPPSRVAPPRHGVLPG